MKLRIKLSGLLSLCVASVALCQYTGGRIVVKPTFFLAKGAVSPSIELQRKLIRHLALAQQRYCELLGFSDTFELDFAPKIFSSNIDAATIKLQPNGAAEFALNQLLKSDRMTRWTCPYVYVIAFVGTDKFPPGSGGRPINGGHNNGGGIIILSAELIDSAINFQSTIQHELGHAFGLVHVDSYGYSMDSSASIMSYNPSHLSAGYQPSNKPGSFIPEDMRGLGMNKVAFPKFQFDPKRHIPSGYEMKPDVVFPPMELDETESMSQVQYAFAKTTRRLLGAPE